MSRIFISHASLDDDFVNRLIADLHGASLSTWVDHHDIPPGKKWYQVIEESLNACDVLLFVVTQAGLASEICGDEWSNMLSTGKTVIPLMLDSEIEFKNLPFLLKNRQAVDFRGDYDSALGKLLSALGVEALPKGSQAHKVIQELPLQVPTGFTLPMLEWCYIPAGKVTIEDHDYQVDAFYMGKYPVTVEQYEYFVADDGYNHKTYWTQAGWEWKTWKGISQPEYWHDSTWHRAKHPIVGVSWYEATAFCIWLSNKMGLNILLPTEQQWQRAAQGDDNRLYPWGDEFDSARCNTKASALNRTTPVDFFSQGVSPYGIYDMSGNIWEWCLNVWDEHQPGEVALSGSLPRAGHSSAFYATKEQAATTYRFSSAPDNYLWYFGFRVCAVRFPSVPETRTDWVE